jgi:hypothetical protein
VATAAGAGAGAAAGAAVAAAPTGVVCMPALHLCVCLLPLS